MERGGGEMRGVCLRDFSVDSSEKGRKACVLSIQWIFKGIFASTTKPLIIDHHSHVSYSPSKSQQRKNKHPPLIRIRNLNLL